MIWPYPERLLPPPAFLQESALEPTPPYVIVGWIHYVGPQRAKCEVCGNVAQFVLDYFGYKGMLADLFKWEEELGGSEAAPDPDAHRKMGARTRQKIFEIQQQGLYHVCLSEALCGSCLADRVDWCLGGDTCGTAAVLRLHPSGGRLSVVLAWKMHPGEPQERNFPCAFYTDAYTFDQLRLQFPPE